MSANHVRNSFTFSVAAAFEHTVPLFGAHAERVWARDDWNPQFLYPVPAKDVPGAVFTLDREGRQSIWINTAFDLQAGHVAYVSVVTGEVITSIDILVRPVDTGHSHVEVVYERTALSPGAVHHVHQLGKHDALAGPEWEESIAKALPGWLKARQLANRRQP
ncbi:hypothetical protein C3F09_06060 [candidate division GN15 bacterium]|uniref:SRPBCC family protein n=1 Tax=candidate division GN15 bacterium TaxID=2072418 RepID=A0A855X7Z9_9BACT|nr:MAG: hypothetical protein C3F09_06060 [candidate division GN15 bacterium]